MAKKGKSYSTFSKKQHQQMERSAKGNPHNIDIGRGGLSKKANPKEAFEVLDEAEKSITNETRTMLSRAEEINQIIPNNADPSTIGQLIKLMALKRVIELRGPENLGKTTTERQALRATLGNIEKIIEKEGWKMPEPEIEPELERKPLRPIPKKKPLKLIKRRILKKKKKPKEAKGGIKALLFFWR